MQIYLRTRGVPRKLDYGFLGPAPGNRWWDAYSELTATERPCLLAVSSKERWRILISGVPSTRTDSVGTLIYYTLVLHGSPEPGGGTGAGEDRHTVRALASRWLSDVAGHPEGRGVLSETLDGLCSGPEVDRLLAAHPAELAAERAELTARLATALASLAPDPYASDPYAPDAHAPDPPAPPAPDAGVPSRVLLGERWIAGRAAPGADAAFADRLSALLAGEAGQAHLLNLVSSGEDIETLPPWPGPLAVLVEGGMVGDPAMRPERLPGPAAEVVGGAPKAPGRAALLPGMPPALTLPLVLLALLVTLLVVLFAGPWT
ncbi:hypothetical protein ACWF94_22560 [Streptomyces sp. NPDC055078]